MAALVCCPVCGDIWLAYYTDRSIGESDMTCYGMLKRDEHRVSHKRSSGYVVKTVSIVCADSHLSEMSSEQRAHYWALAKLFDAANSGE